MTLVATFKLLAALAAALVSAPALTTPPVVAGVARPAPPPAVRHAILPESCAPAGGGAP